MIASAAVATPRVHRATVTSIGTGLAARSVMLRNELAGTVRDSALRAAFPAPAWRS